MKNKLKNARELIELHCKGQNAKNKPREMTVNIRYYFYSWIQRNMEILSAVTNMRNGT